jgi:hypothetical protein
MPETGKTRLDSVVLGSGDPKRLAAWYTVEDADGNFVNILQYNA